MIPPRESGPRSLLESLQGLIERTYRMDTGVREIGRYVIGDEGYRRFYGRRAPSLRAPEESRAARSAALVVAGEGAVEGRERREDSKGVSAAARVLVHDNPDGLAAHIYFPDRLIRRLEDSPPMRGLCERNVDDFATFVEELDHFLFLAERARQKRHVSLLELELQANVTKYLVCALFLAGGSDRRPRGGAGLDGENRLWLHYHLFEKIEFAEPDPVVRSRYRDALRFARRFIDRLERIPRASDRVARLRAFHAATHQQKIAALA
jgi:hypothetical protein